MAACTTVGMSNGDDLQNTRNQLVSSSSGQTSLYCSQNTYVCSASSASSVRGAGRGRAVDKRARSDTEAKIVSVINFLNARPSVYGAVEDVLGEFLRAG